MKPIIFPLGVKEIILFKTCVMGPIHPPVGTETDLGIQSRGG